MSAAEPTSQKKRTLIVHKDEGGYGLTLSGDKPTRVQTVRINGASHRSGVREGDVILKVNGQQVTDSDHNEVVKLIQGGSYVALTVVHTSRIIPEARVGYEGVEREACRSPTASITGPVPASEAILLRTQSSSLTTLQLMLEEEIRENEKIKSQLARSNSKKLRNLKSLSDRKVTELQSKIHQLRYSSPEKTSCETKPRFGPLPPTPGSTIPPPSPCSNSTPSSSPSTRLSSISDSSIPVAPPRSESLNLVDMYSPPPLPVRNTAPTPPPRNPTTGLPPPPPKIPRHSSHETLYNDGGRQGSNAPPLSPPRDVVHVRTRSSPVSLGETLEVGRYPGGVDGGAGSRSPRYETPPGTPPPPYNPGQDPAHLLTWGGLTGTNIMTMIIQSSDTFLAEEQEREESLRKMFWKVRQKARDVLKIQLDDFRAKRAAGMGNIYGPPEHELRAAEENPLKRNQIIEDTLLPLFDTMADDFENATDNVPTSSQF